MWPRSWRAGALLVCSLVAGTSQFLTVGLAQQPPRVDDQVRDHLAAGEFGPAWDLVQQVQDRAQRDDLLAQVAAAQRGAGMSRASYGTASAIDDDSSRSSLLGELGSQPIGGMPGRGGAALADFDTLIQLITSTISPDTWEEVGGPGAIEPFPTGVLVDASGLMKRVTAEGKGSDLASVRDASATTVASGDVAVPSALRKVSLTRLERQLQVRQALGIEPDSVMRNLAGLQRVKYVFYYPQTHDIIIAGPAGPWHYDIDGRSIGDSGQSVLQLDDLAVVLRNATDGGGKFGCAITPTQDNLAGVQSYLRDSAAQPLKPGQRDAWLKGLRDRLGRQDVSVFGIDPRTHAARVLVEADYHMKLVGMGLEEGTLGVSSYLDSVKIASGGAPPAMDVLRWWFTLNYDALRTTPTRDAFELRGNGVKVLSENELLTARGERVHTGKADDLNSQFAHSFTAHFEELARKYPIYADLRGVFDLALVAALIRAERLDEQAAWRMSILGDAAKFPVRLAAVPKQVETVMNHRLVEQKHIIVGVSGGVSFDANSLVQAQAIKADEYGLMSSDRASATPNAAREIWWWD